MTFALTAVALASNHTAPASPSFLFMLADDIGWADFGYNNGTAHTPRIDAWARAKGSVLLQDFHSGGTVCSPTRATVLTGRNHFRDCVDYVYDCSDMTECVPAMAFAPRRTFTVGDAVRAALPNSESFFAGKWHLGSFYNDSSAYGGITSSPLTHGFDQMNATVEVAPTMTTNWQCTKEWDAHANFGHYGAPNHCAGGPNPGGSSLPDGCCFNYWRGDPDAPHGVSNQTTATVEDDSLHLSDAFHNFVASRGGAPFFAQLSFHNCHIPFLGNNATRDACARGETCAPPAAGAPPYTFSELDFYSCLTLLDGAVGRVLDTLEGAGYRDDTMVWFTTDNGPEVNCHPEGICEGAPHRPTAAPGSAGPLRGRKRDIWEGGHRVPGIVAWPAVVGDRNLESWTTVGTFDFLPTVMEVLGVMRPAAQAGWAVDGTSILPVLRGEPLAARGVGWVFVGRDPRHCVADPKLGYGFRYGKWKLVVGSVSCTKDDCRQPQLYDLDADLGERHDLAIGPQARPDVLKAIEANFSAWFGGVLASRKEESRCPQDAE